MSGYFERLREEAVKEAVKEAIEKTEKKIEKKSRESFALKLLRRGKDTVEEIAECTGLTLRRVKALAKTV